MAPRSRARASASRTTRDLPIPASPISRVTEGSPASALSSAAPSISSSAARSTRRWLEIRVRTHRMMASRAARVKTGALS